MNEPAQSSLLRKNAAVVFHVRGSGHLFSEISQKQPPADLLKLSTFCKFFGHRREICRLTALVQGNDGEEWRPCQIFPGKLVAANGWCTVWAPKG